MLLQRLKEYQLREQDDSDQTETPAEYSSQAIPWIVDVSISGSNASVIRTSGGTAKRDTGKQFNVPYLKRSGTNIKPQLLADKAEIALGVVAEDPIRAQKRHADFLALVEACAQATADHRVRAVATFLQQLPEQPLQLPPELQTSDFVTFMVNDVRLVELGSVQQFWLAVAPHLGRKGLPQLTPELVLSWLTQSDEGVRGQCIVCGEGKPIARVHPVAIKLPRSVSDQQLSIVTANKEAFYSYGLEQSFIAPTCRDCAASYANALNALARSKQNNLVLGSAIFMFWTREDVGFDLMTFLDKPDADTVRLLFDSPRSGNESAHIQETAFYATSISGSGARVVVRDWIDTTVGAVQANLHRWFVWQRIADMFGEEPRPLSLFQLAIATVREMKDIPTTTSRALLHTALTGTPLPMSLLYQAVRRSRAEQGVTRQRAALIKLVLLSHEPSSKEATMIDLDQNHPDPAYHCGRLLAVLADIQEAAIGKAAIVDRFYGTASSAPGSVFGRLLRGAQPHIAKLERDRRNVAVALKRRLEGVMSSLDSFPKILTLEQQGLFALGFYHQRAYDHAQMYANAARKQAVATTSADDTELFTDDETE